MTGPAKQFLFVNLTAFKSQSSIISFSGGLYWISFQNVDGTNVLSLHNALVRSAISFSPYRSPARQFQVVNRGRHPIPRWQCILKWQMISQQVYAWCYKDPCNRASWVGYSSANGFIAPVKEETKLHRWDFRAIFVMNHRWHQTKLTNQIAPNKAYPWY